MGSPEIMAAWDEMCLKCAEYDAMVEQRDDLAAVVKEIGRGEWSHWVGPGSETWPECIFCGAFYEDEKTEHEPDCLVSRARTLAARLPPG
jgi:hypothetical protein